MGTRALAVIAVAASTAALLIAILYRPAPPDTSGRICALLGAIMSDNDSPAGLSARALELYREDGCR